jgi:hypothetical protein
MLLLFAVLGLVAAAVVLISYLARQNRDPVGDSPVQTLPPANLRPLFAPTDDDLRKFERDERAKITDNAEETRARTAAERGVEIVSLTSDWASSPNKQTAIDLIHLAADHGDAEIFAGTATEIIRVFRSTGINGLAVGDLAALLDSHCRLLPAGEQSSGELFWLKQEIARLAH